MTRLLTAILLIATLSLGTAARTRTTQRGLTSSQSPVTRIDADSTAAYPDAVDQNAVILRGYTKRASDSRESFLITNNTSTRMSHVRLRFRYSALDGATLHERDVTVEVNLKPGETRLVSITSWDKQRMFYYHGGPQPRKAATPYSIAFALLGYDIPVGN